LRWSVTDGVNLTDFARPSAYDAIVSNQVLEHLHPDDILQHLRGAHALLRPGGRYVLRTPHAFAGPHDIGRVFGLERPVGMHRHEYDYTELSACMREAGFAIVMAPFALPQRIRRRIGGVGVWTSTGYLRYLLWAERVLRRLSRARRKWVFTRLPKLFLFRRDGMIVGVKSG
jgi:SAM-dependent methyltransferase